MILSKIKTQSLNLDQLLDDHIHQNKLDELLIVVPTNRKIRYLKRELISLSPDKAVSKLNLFTLGTLATEIFQTLNIASAKVLTDASAAVLLDKAFRETKLSYFSNYKDGIPRGTLDRIKNVISEYKRHGISPERILNESDNLSGSEKLKAIDISNIYRIYLNNCKNLNAYEIGDIYSSILSISQYEFESKFRKIFVSIKRIVINGFDEFTQPEIEIIDSVSKVKEIELYVVFDYYKYNPALFSHLNACYENLKAKGFNEVEDTSAAFYKSYQKRIRENLFMLNENDESFKSEIEITKLKANTPTEEIKLIAKEIKSLIIKKNVSPDTICVAYNLISEHSYIIRDVFSEYGIPFNLTDRFSLSESQPIIALINFLEIQENNFYYKNIFRALTGRWISIRGIELSNLLRVASNLKIVSGFNNWIDTLDRVIDEIKNNQVDEESRYLPIEFYINAKENIESIQNLLKPFNSRLGVDEFLDLIRKLIYDLRLQEKIVNDHSPQIEKNVKALTVFLEMMDEIFYLLKSEIGESKKYPMSFYLTHLKTALQFTRYNIKERHGSGVLVTSVDEIRGLNFDYVFLGGLVDGEFPTRYQPEIFFSGSFKKDEYKHNLEERYHFYQALCNVNKSLYLCYYLNDGKKEFIESTFLNDFNRIFYCNQKSAKDLENLIYSKSELLTLAGTNKNKNIIEELYKYGIDENDLEKNQKVDSLRQKNLFEESPFTGYILSELSDDAKIKLEEHTQKQFSISMLEDYAKCPFQYFLKRILMLETIEEPIEELESFELGSIVHSILFEFYRSIKEKNLELKNCSDEIFKQAEKIIFEIAGKKIERLHFKSPLIFFEKEKILGIAGNKRNSILYKFLEEERKTEDGFMPHYFELEFGKFKNSDEDYFAVEVEGVKVRGKIDRVDLDFNNKKYKVIDYKLSGKSPAKKEIETGISLQLALYLYASKLFIETQLNETFDPAAAIIYSLKLKKDEFGPKTIHISKSRNPKEDELIKSNEELIKICNKFIPLYVKEIRNGKFNLSILEDRENKVCRFCDFKSICRIQDAK
jgi:ATP-dependent helicase/nuclease subunit B